MPAWRDEYLNALLERDTREKANKNIYDSYTKLADRTSSFQSALTTETDKTHKEPALSPGPKDSKTGRDVGTPSVLDSADAIAKVRQDLAEAQRSRSLMAAKLHSVTEELKELKIQSSLNNQRIDELVKEKGALVTGMRDRDEELRGKAKLLEDVHDETVSLTLQLNMAEATSQKLQRENKDLVDRWMTRMGKEADAMNDESKFT